MMDLVGAVEAGLIMGRTGERVRQLYKAGLMPPPVGRIGRQVIWERWQIEDWCRFAGREPVISTAAAADSDALAIEGQQELFENPVTDTG